MKLKIWDIVEIEWLDSLHSSGWRLLSEKTDDFENKDYLTHFSVGYFLAETSLSIVVAQSLQKKVYERNDRLTDARMEIPLSSVKKIRLLKSYK